MPIEAIASYDGKRRRGTGFQPSRILGGGGIRRLGRPGSEDGSKRGIASDVLLGGNFEPSHHETSRGEQGCTVTVLIDSGASHNFISVPLVLLLHMTPDRITMFGVQLGDGRRQESERICKNVSLTLQGCEIVADCYVFGLRGVHVIFGVAWLVTLREVKVNWKTMSMAFEWKDRNIVLQGDPMLCRSPVGLRALTRMQDVKFCAVVIEGEPMKLTESQSHRVTHILQQFTEVFGEPEGLPPKRTRDHRIELVPGAGPVSVRPYRYDHIQKDEIEHLVADMLLAGIIRPSSSPFSSPVLLVKKKDGSWRFYVDYRELNKVMILDKYPIPVIQEMLDELAGVFKN